MPKELTAFRVAPDLMDAMRRVKAKIGIPIAVQLDKALRAWLTAKGALPKAKTSPKGPRRSPEPKRSAR
jgi:hypothetical protein